MEYFVFVVNAGFRSDFEQQVTSALASVSKDWDLFEVKYTFNSHLVHGEAQCIYSALIIFTKNENSQPAKNP